MIKFILSIVFLYFLTSKPSIEENLYDDEKYLENLDSIFSSNQDRTIFNRIVKEEICNIPVESFEILTQEDFILKYAFSQPVVFRRSSQSNRNKLFEEKCQLDNLLKNFGNKPVTVSSANTHSYKRYSMRFKDYVKKYMKSNSDETEPRHKLKYGNETWYFFGENNYTEWKDIFDSYERPKYTLPKHVHAYSFGVAGSFSGVPFHFHGPGFAETAVGRKRWFLYPPEEKPEFDPDKSTTQWFIDEYKNLKYKPLECVLHPLDVIYFPDRWWHATLNIDPIVVFISTFLSPI